MLSGVLASVLPGVRELRAPLAAGYLWLFAVWMVFGEGLPDSKEVKEPLSRLYALEPLLSSVGVAAVASVCAYVVGSLAIDAHVWLRRNLRQLTPGVTQGKYAVPLGSEGERRLLDLLAGEPATDDDAERQAPISAPAMDGDAERQAHGERAVDDAKRQASLYAGWKHIDDHRDVLKTRILVASQPLHSEVDRPDAEGTLRSALWPPLTVLTIYFGASGSRGWFFALLVSLLIAAQARSRSKQANDALLVAITVDPAIEKSVRDDLGMDKTLLGIDDKARRLSSRD